MSDQCPSSVKEAKPGKAALAATTRDLPRLAGTNARVWRSLDEVADTGEFRDWIEREFPRGASEFNDQSSRRTFLKIMGASVALAGAATLPGCRRPDHKIMPYSAKAPEDTIPGKPTLYATAMPIPGGGAEGLLVETHEGRPTKVEGNPLHPNNRGKSTVWSQASVLDLYDPDRLKFPTYRPRPGDDRLASWDDFKVWSKDHLQTFDSTRGKGLAFLVQKRTSPSLDFVRDRIKARFPQAMWVPYSAADSDGAARGTQAAFGAPMRDVLTMSGSGKVAAKVIVSLDRDFLEQTDPACLPNSREFAATRRSLTVKDEMSRLYVVESTYSITGAAADHRLRLAPSRIPAFAVMLARAVLENEKVRGNPDAGALAQAVREVATPVGEDIPQKFVDAVAEDLLAESDGHGGSRTRTGETLILAGPSQPPAVHALCHALNAVLGNIGKTVRYVPMRTDEAASSAEGIRALAGAMAAHEVKTLICVNVNPVYDAPAELDFAKHFGHCTTVCLSVEDTETAAAANWSLNGAHFLESWGDAESWDGTIAPIQPMIAPLYDPARSDIEFLAILADPEAAIVKSTPPVTGDATAPAPPKVQRTDDGHRIVQEAWRVAIGGGIGAAAFEKKWRRALHDGVLADLAKAPATPKLNAGAVAAEVSKLSLGAPPTEQSLDVAFVVGRTHDGRYANNAWVQELPQTGTRVVWDNPALMSPKTAEKLGLAPQRFSSEKGGAEDIYTQKYPEARVAKFTLGGRSVDVAVWIMPGMADNTVIFQLGYGRQHAGRVGDGVGFNVNPIRTTEARWMSRGATATKVARTYPISSTQNHWSLEGRTALLRQVDLVAWQKYGAEPPVEERDRLYGTTKKLNFAERVSHGELTHTPPNLNIYPHPYNKGEPKPGEKHMDGRGLTPEPGSEYAKGPQWGMSIDLSTCTGCGACTTACQAENNIPVIGKKEVAKGREMSWIRVDRYFVSDDHGELGNINEPTQMLHQPVACVHCENAPCETVCPVNATVHGPEGLNYMTYNRCIGTRYCANNCPYKVRRFNYFDYGVTKFNGDYIGKDTLEKVIPDRGGVTGSGQHNKVNVNLIPPRLRQKLDEISKMQKNPDVTVRSRGVMEKCSFCVQRINEARIEMKIRKIAGAVGVPEGGIPEGFLQTACQQACPSSAITFGDIRDTTSNDGKGSLAYQMREHPRSYLLLGYLNTRPRTTHMVRVSNPNPKLRKPIENPFGHHDDHHDHGTGHDKGHSRLDSAGPEDPGRAAFLRDSAKHLADKGYALSLRVLGGGVL
jgi:molybdopterin-containing oxidoreductase family iron-sulfur binding subunit